MNTTSFNLETVILVLQKRFKQIIIFVFISLIVASIAFIWSTKYYRSTALVIPANSLLADKSRLSNANIQNLYAFTGNSDDAETLLGIAKSDTILYRLVDELSLVDYYRSKGKNDAEKRKNTISLLQKDLQIEKTEFNQLRIMACTKSPELSANMVNSTIETIQQIEQQMWKLVYQKSTNKIAQSVKELENEYESVVDSISKTAVPYKKELLETKRLAILEQVKQFQKSESELRLALETTPPTLYTIEKAFPSASADKPLFLTTIATAFFISLVFAMIGALVFDKNQRH